MTKEIIPPFMGENIERSKQRRKLIDEIIEDLSTAAGTRGDPHVIISLEKLEKLKEIS